MSGDYVIETRGLAKSFGGFRAVDDVNLKVERGSIHALIGPNGAGKSTMFNLITKFLQPTEGKIIYEGRDITRARAAAVSRMGMVRSFQISSTFPHLTVHTNVRVALQRRLGMSFHFWKPESRLRVLDEEADALLADVGLLEFRDALAVELPYGRKRLLEVATTLAQEPKVMLLDEPMAGMGAADVARVTELIRRAAQGRTVVMVEHNIRVVADLSDRITVLARGTVLAEGTYDEVSNDERVVTAYMGGMEEHA